MSQPPRDVREMSLYDLFASEVQSHLQPLDAGLLRLERDPSDTGVIEPMMRAAHSIKGAARIVDLDGLVELAHAMEDCLGRRSGRAPQARTGGYRPAVSLRRCSRRGQSPGRSRQPALAARAA